MRGFGGELRIGLIELIAGEMVREGFCMTGAGLIATGYGAGIPEIRGCVVAGNADAVLTQVGVVHGRVREPLLSSEASPVRGLSVIDGDTRALEIADGEIGLGEAEALIGGSAQPCGSAIHVG